MQKCMGGMKNFKIASFKRHTMHTEKYHGHFFFLFDIALHNSSLHLMLILQEMSANYALYLFKISFTIALKIKFYNKVNKSQFYLKQRNNKKKFVFI